MQCDPNGSGGATVKANGVDITSQLTNGSLTNTTISVTSPLTSLSLVSNSGDAGYLGSVTIDGTMLVDPLIRNTSTIVATNFNPFTDDINAIRGQASGYATFNPISEWIDSGTLSDGNLTFTSTSGGNARGTATIRPTSGKWYCEFDVINADRFSVGVENTNKQTTFQGGGSTNSVIVFYSRPAYYNNTSFNNYLDASMSDGDIIQVALDLDNTAVWIGRNNIWGGGATSSEIVNGVVTNSLTSFIGSTTPLTGDVGIFVEDNSGSGAMSARANFGQKPFKFSPPDGFQPLGLSNTRPEKVIARPDQYVAASIWTGDNTENRLIPLNMKPDFIWIKQRNDVRVHILQDSVRGFTKGLYSDDTSVESTRDPAYGEAVTGGFEVSNNAGSNVTGRNMVDGLGRLVEAKGNLTLMMWVMRMPLMLI